MDWAPPSIEDEVEPIECTSPPPGVKGGISEDPVDIDSDRELQSDGVVGDCVLNCPALFDADMKLGAGGAGVKFER